MTYRLGISIVTYKSAATLPSCLDSIRAFSPTAAVAIVENSGQTGRIAEIAESFLPLDVTVHNPGANVGFASGVNLAAAILEEKHCTHVLILNPDVELLVDPATLLPALDNADVVAGLLLAEHGSDSDRLPRVVEPLNAKKEVTWWSSLLKGMVGTRFTRVRNLGPEMCVSVPQVDGAYMLQTTAYYSTHRLDERFELYYEDVDYCDRARRGRGIALLRVPVGVHGGGASAANSGGRAYVVQRVSQARYLRRKYPRMPPALVAIPFGVEFVTRTITRQAEGSGARRQAVHWAFRELRDPGTIHLLNAGAQTRGARGV